MLSDARVKISWQQIADWAISWLLTTGIAYFSKIPFSPLPIKAIVMIQASCLMVLSYLFYPRWGKPGFERTGIAIWSAMVAVSAFVIAQIDHLPLLPAGRIALAVFLLNVFLQCLAFASCTSRANMLMRSWLILWCSLLLTTLPIWISPWIESINRIQTELDLLLWSNPLSYLASMLDYDYLRSDWFYRHTPFNMYRYAYPDPVWASICLVAACLILLMVTKPRPD